MVFEVIQLPSSNGDSTEEQTVTMIDGNTLLLNGGDPQEYSIIEPADDSVNDFLHFNESVSDTEDVKNTSIISCGKKNSELTGM